jgi:hypothetical protein
MLIVIVHLPTSLLYPVNHLLGVIRYRSFVFSSMWRISIINISFETEEQLWKTMTLKRWQVLKVMTGAGKLTIR